MTNRLETRVRSQTRALQKRNLWRRLQAPSGVDLCSNDYLGLADHPSLKAAMIEAVGREGCGSTGSRLLRGERESFAAVERKFAAFKGAARALYFSSGYLANLAVLTTFARSGDLILCDDRSHASVIDGVRLSHATHRMFPHNDAAALSRLLEEPRTGQAFVVTESLFSMDGDVPPLAEYAAVCRTAGAALIIDEAHAVGVFGPGGSGLIEESGITDDTFISINTAGKALGVAGAFVAGPEWAIEHLIQRARPFVFSTAPPPSLAAALDASLTVIAAEPDRRRELARLSRVARQRLTAAGIAVDDGVSQIIPIVLGENNRALRVAEALQSNGFDVRAIRPPTVPPGTARLRISINVKLDDGLIDRFVETLVTALRAWPAPSTAAVVSGAAPTGRRQEAWDAT